MRTTIILVSLSIALGCGKSSLPKKEERLLWAFEMGNGVISSPFNMGDGVISSPAIGSDGTLYVGSVDYKLYAIKTDSKGPAKSPWPMRGQNPQHTGRAPAK